MVEMGTEHQDEEVEADVAALAGHAASGTAALANLEQSLRPVERYAVRFLEEVGVSNGQVKA